MAKYTGPSCRLCRRERMKLFLKGTRCTTVKCAFERRPHIPGQAGGKEPKLSSFGLHLREKQKVRRMYGVGERQFRQYFSKSQKAKGVTGIKLLQYLERRLDNVLVRLGFATSHSQARQIVRHRFINVNGKRVDIPSYIVKTNDVIKVIKNDQKSTQFIKDNLQLLKDKARPSWVGIDVNAMTGKILRLPEKSDINLPIQEQMIVELYSK